MKIIHCLLDDKFMDGTIRVYEKDSRHHNDYVIVKKHPERYEFKYIKSLLVKKTTPHKFLESLNQYDVVVLHSFSCLKNSLICKIPQKCKVVWYAWGFDIYDGVNAIVPIKLYGRETAHYKQNHSTNRGVISCVYNIVQNFYLSKALSRIDYFSGVFPYEYDLVKEYNSSFRAKQIDFYYGDTNFFIKDCVLTDYAENKKDIIIGNSADPCNNHHDALTALSQVDLPADTRIIIPLSYAGDEAYARWVSDYADTLFPGRVKPLVNYLPLDEYINTVSNCKVAIFYHERQQATDNIFMQMLYGAKVFMSETSLAYKYLKDKGFIVFSLQSDIKSLMTDFAKEDVLKNRELLAELYSETTIISRVIEINNIISSDINSQFNSQEEVHV